MIILQLCVMLNTKILMGKNSKYVSKRSSRLSSSLKSPTVRVSDHSNIKILSPKQMLQRLPIALAQVEAGNTFENLLNEIRKII